MSHFSFWRVALRAALLFCLLGWVSLIGSAQDTPEPITLRVMSFNIWVGGELVNFHQVAEAIRASGADIVGLQEATGNTRRLAESLGWYYSERQQIIARFPLIEPAEAEGRYLYVQPSPGQVLAVANVHLTSDPYGPYAARDGAALEEVLMLERETRLPDITPVLTALGPLVAEGVPVMLTGDFNAPSHRDWTPAVDEARDEVPYPVAWVVSQVVEDAGFQDTFRMVYPDPVAHPGITWTYGYPYPRLNAGEVSDRIDFVYAANVLEIQESQVVGPLGAPVGIGIAPFPSDHSGVVSTLRLLPVQPPVLVAVQDPVITQGDEIVVWYHTAGGEATDRIGIVAGGADDVLMWLPPYEASFFGSVTFGSGALAPGEYSAILLGADNIIVSRSPFVVLARGAVPRIATSADTYQQGDAITVIWENAPGMRWDWVAVYSAGDPDLYNNYWGYAYTGATAAGQIILDSAVFGDDMLSPGDYVVRLLLDDGFQVLAEASFTITE